jgi:ABC-type sugar transport system ATPase subunit
MRIEIGALQRRLKTTTVFVTHDQVEAMTLGDRIVVLADGRIQQVGRPIELYRSPVNRFVAGFIGTPPMNFIDGDIRRANGQMQFVADGMCLMLLAERMRGAQASESVTLGVRPEDLELVTGDALQGGMAGGRSDETAGGRVRGQVLLVERLGGTSHIHFEVGANRLLVTATGEQLPAVDDVVDVRIPSHRLHLFGSDGRAFLKR